MRASAVVMGVVLLVTTTACGGGGGKSGKKTVKAAELPVPQVTITPNDGTRRAKPERGIEIGAVNGTLDTVSVQLKGQDVPGELSADKTSWKSTWTLTPGSDYTVTATARNAQKSTTATSKFHTLKPSSTLGITTVVPDSTMGKTVGVGMPIIVDFDRSVTDKKAVEKALEVKSEQPSEGAWLWTGDTEAIFRTKDYWAPHQKITFTAHLAGVKSGASYGMSDTTLNFKIGDSRISKVSTRTHRMKVYINDKLEKNVGISAGRGGAYKYYTTSGIHLTMEAVSPVTMTSPGLKKGDPGYYSETVYDAVRISNSGEYVHSAPWSVGDQGVDNVSHGCVNASPEFAKWFYDTSQWGDPVIVTGTPRPLEWDNGYGFWQKPWDSWLKGSATGQSFSTTGGPVGTDPSASPTVSTGASPTGSPATSSPSGSPVASSTATPVTSQGGSSGGPGTNQNH